jgi:hypothetical protein
MVQYTSRYKTEELEMWQAESLLRMHMKYSHAIDYTTVLSEHTHPGGEVTYGVTCLYSCGWTYHTYYPTYHVAMSRLNEHEAVHHTTPVRSRVALL